jgi:hypothetical protein
MRTLSNWNKFILMGAFALGGATSGFSQTREALPPANALIVFGANWCAPCLQELRELPALAAAVVPAQIIIAWRDGAPRKVWPSWPANAEVRGPAEADRWAGGADLSAGLPYAVLLDGQGKHCVVWNGRVTPERIARLKARCPSDR